MPKAGDKKKKPKASKKKSPARKSRVYTPQAKQLLALNYLIHGSIRQAALVCGIPVRTAQGWRQSAEWDNLMDEATRQRNEYMARPETDVSWSRIAELIDKIALMGGAVSAKHLQSLIWKIDQAAELAEKGFTITKDLKLTKEDIALAGRLFGIAVDKAMAVRGIGREGGHAGTFEEFQQRLADRIAALITDDDDDSGMLQNILQEAKEKGKDAVNINRLTTFTPRPPAVTEN